MKNKVKKIFLMILLCNIVVLIVPFYTHAAQKGWVKVGKTSCKEDKRKILLFR